MSVSSLLNAKGLIDSRWIDGSSPSGSGVSAINTELSGNVDLSGNNGVQIIKDISSNGLTFYNTGVLTINELFGNVDVSGGLGISITKDPSGNNGYIWSNDGVLAVNSYKGDISFNAGSNIQVDSSNGVITIGTNPFSPSFTLYDPSGATGWNLIDASGGTRIVSGQEFISNTPTPPGYYCVTYTISAKNSFTFDSPPAPAPPVTSGGFRVVLSPTASTFTNYALVDTIYYNNTSEIPAPNSIDGLTWTFQYIIAVDTPGAFLRWQLTGDVGGQLLYNDGALAFSLENVQVLKIV